MSKNEKDKKKREKRYKKLLKMLKEVEKKTKKKKKVRTLTIFYENNSQKSYNVKEVSVHMENEQYSIELHFNPWKLKNGKWVHKKYRTVKLSHIKKVTIKKHKL